MKNKPHAHHTHTHTHTHVCMHMNARTLHTRTHTTHTTRARARTHAHTPTDIHTGTLAYVEHMWLLSVHCNDVRYSFSYAVPPAQALLLPPIGTQAGGVLCIQTHVSAVRVCCTPLLSVCTQTQTDRQADRQTDRYAHTARARARTHTRSVADKKLSADTQTHRH